MVETNQEDRKYLCWCISHCPSGSSFWRQAPGLANSPWLGSALERSGSCRGQTGKETLMMGTMIIKDQTGIQASPIQHLTTIFLGSSYRKSTWTIDHLIQVLFEMNSHHILLHSGLHIVEVLHLLWLVIIPQRATTPSPYLRVQWKLVLRRWKQHFVLPCCHSYLMPAAIWKQTFLWF